MHSFTAIVLAGGKGTRLGGVDKAFVTLAEKPLIDHKLEELRRLTANIIVVTNHPDRYHDYSDIVLVQDKTEGHGPLMGIYSGLIGSTTSVNFITAVDMPFFNVGFFSYMRGFAEDYDVVIPRISGRYEPLFAFYSSACAQKIDEKLKEGKRRIVSILECLTVKEIDDGAAALYDADKQSLLNINTGEELQRITGLIKDKINAPG